MSAENSDSQSPPTTQGRTIPWASFYDSVVWLLSLGKGAAMRNKTVSLAEIKPGDRVLDVGCGTGLTGLALRHSGFAGPIDGIDLSSTSLKAAERHDVYRSLTAMDLQTLPLPIVDDTYDALLCVGVLTYIPDGENVLREFTRCVRSGGQVLITQRDDLFRERGDSAMFERLSDVVDDIKISEPLPYLPSHPDFGDEIKVIYSMMTVS